MPLRIELVGGRVCLPKFNLDFPFAPPPEKLTQAALGCFAALRQRLAYLTNSTKEEKQEVMQLLTAYGQALYASLVPPRLQDKVSKERGICIKAKDPALEALPWELLHDGNSFFALTSGVTRAFMGASPPPVEPHRVLQRLGVSLYGYAPLGEAERKRHGGSLPELGNRFLTLVEELPLGLWDNQDLQFRVNGQASRQAILDALQAAPQFFFFSGYDEGDSWLLYGLDSGPSGPNLKEAFLQAVAKGLRILGVNSSSLLLGYGPAKYFGFGVPLLLAQSGRMGRKRFRVYFQEFVQGLLREDPVLKAHRHALNQLYSELPQSWDWAFLRLYVNQHTLETGPDPLRPFTFLPFAGGPNPAPPVRAEILADRPFAGNQEVLSQILRQLLTEQQSRPLWIRSLEGQPQEEYLLEFFRRILAGQNFYWKLLYYRRWGYQEDQKKHLTPQHFGGKFTGLFEAGPVLQYFEDSLITMAEGVERGLQYLTVYYPPDHADPVFETWLKTKQAEGWQVILLSHASFVTDQPTQIISTDSISRREIEEALEDELPEVWEAAMQQGIPPQLRLLPLLKLMARCASAWTRPASKASATWKR